MNFTQFLLSVCRIVLPFWLIVINVFAVYQTVRDKSLSRTAKDSPQYWRIPEAQLLLIAALGGSVSMYATMKLIHHKTRHPQFMIGIPVIMLVQAAWAGLLLWLRYC